MVFHDADLISFLLILQVQLPIAIVVNLFLDTVWFAMYLNQVCTKFLSEHLENAKMDYADKLKRMSSFVQAAYLYLNR